MIDFLPLFVHIGSDGPDTELQCITCGDVFVTNADIGINCVTGSDIVMCPSCNTEDLYG